ncbi:MAG: type II secretion system F family protein [Candidatus Micrarchaeota archaeon]
MGYYLRALESDVDEGEYFIMSVMNAIIWAAIVFILVRMKDAYMPFSSIILPTLATFVLFLTLFIIYPRILVSKYVESLDRDLVYALKDLHIQITSGMTLFEAMKSVSVSEHGFVSHEFKGVIQDINAGEAQDIALEKLATRSESEFMKKTIWQIVIALRSGASLQGTIKDLVDNMRQFQKSNVKSYTQEMNLWILLYLIVAIAIPSLGATLMTILSSFSTTSIQESTFIVLLSICFMAEYAIIKYVKIRRPLVYM